MPAVIAVLNPTGFSYTAQGGLDVRVAFTESGKIVIAEQKRSSLVHLVEIKIIKHLARIHPKERVLTQMDIIMICPRHCAEPCVHAAVYGHGLICRNVPRQQPVELIYKLRTVKFAVEVEMRYHHARMYPGISPPRARHGHVVTQQRRQGVLKHLLHRKRIGLHLPSVVGRTVISEIKKISLHRRHAKNSDAKVRKYIFKHVFLRHK